METHRIRVARSARYHVLGSIDGASIVWVVLHGYGHLAAAFLAEFEHLVGDGRAFVAPEGLSRFYLRRTTGRIGASWMTSEDRDAEIEDHVGYLDTLVDSLGLGESGGPRLGVLGFSQGVATACRWCVQGETVADRLVLWAGGVPPDLDLERARERWCSTELTLVAGEADGWATADVQARDLERLHEAGLSVRSHLFEGGHHLDPGLLGRLLVPDT